MVQKLKTNRRDFVRLSALGTLGTALGACSGQPPASAAGSGTYRLDAPVPKRPFGRSGEEISMLGLGGYHIAVPSDDQDGIRLVREAIDAGVTFLDNAWEYHRGRAEEIMGKALQDGYREKAFLMTKHHGRDKATAMRHLEDSLRRLRTDVIDLWQFHEVIYERDPEMIFAPGGGIEAAEQAKKEGKVRYIGFTGHKDPRIHKKMLDQSYEWDAVQMPLNVFDAQYKRSFEKEILPICVERGIAVLAMKALCSGHLQRANVVTPQQAHRYVYSLPVTTLISGMETMDVLHRNIQTAVEFEPLSREESGQILSQAHDAALSGEYEPFKTTRAFDGRIGRELHGVI
jgi:predicted aldo/keto reductase-like oxidoreductase